MQHEVPGAPEEFHNKVNKLPLLEGTKTLIIPKNLLVDTSLPSKPEPLFTMNVLPALRLPLGNQVQVDITPQNVKADSET